MMTDTQFKVMDLLMVPGYLIHCIQSPNTPRDVGRTVSIQKGEPNAAGYVWTAVNVGTFDSLRRRGWIHHTRTQHGNDHIHAITFTGVDVVDFERIRRRRLRERG